MKRNVKQLLITVVCLLCGICVYAHDFEVDGIYYKFNRFKTSVRVTSPESSDFKEYSGDVVIPATVTYEDVAYDVVQIDYNAFSSCTALTSVVIGENITYIPEGVFSGCVNLESIKVSEGNLNYNSRNDCNAIIRSSALLHGCQNTVIPQDVTTIEARAFEGMTNLKSIVIPSQVIIIYDMAFAGCTGLTEIYCEGYPPTISYNTFENVDRTIPIRVPYEYYDLYRYDGYWGEFTQILPHNAPSVPSATSIVMDIQELEMWEYDFSYLSVIIEPAEANSQEILWQSSDENVATVNENGVVNAWAEGVTTITATTTDGSNLSASCVVSVKDRLFPYGRKFEKDGIYYIVTVEDTEVAVTYPDNNEKYVGDIVIPETITMQDVTCRVTSIGEKAFDGCIDMTSVDIPNTVTLIGDYAFNGCIDMTSVDIPNTVTSIGYYTFNGCSNLTSITLPEYLYDMGDYVFTGCNSLSEINVNAARPPYISAYTFYDIDKSIPVYVPHGSLERYQSARYWSEFTNISLQVLMPVGTVFEQDGIGFEVTVADKEVKIISCVGPYVNVPGDLFYKNIYFIVSDIEENLFRNRDDIESVALYGITSIDNEMFSGCTNLLDAGFSDELVFIGDSAFCDCSKIVAINIPRNLQSIGDNAFRNCTGLTYIYSESYIPPTIYENTFFGVDKNLSMVNVPVESVSEYKNSAYWSEFKNYDGFVLPGAIFEVDGIKYETTGSESVAVIYNEESPYSGAINIPSEVTYYDKTLFVSAIFEYAFNNCENLTSITIPNSVNFIGYMAFNGCTGLSVVDIPEGETRIQTMAFANCTGLSTVNIPESVTSIDYGAFMGCTSLTSVSIPNSVFYIGQKAFENCSALTDVSIGENVSEISNDAFSGCTSLVSLELHPITPPYIYDNTFAYVDKSIPIKVRYGTLHMYQSADYWNEFTNIEEDINGVLAEGIKFEYNGLFYRSLGDGTVAVANSGDSEYYPHGYSGDIVIPNSVEYYNHEYSVVSIDFHAFYYCDLTSLYIPRSVTSLSGDAFISSNYNLQSIIVEEGNPVYDSRENCNAIIDTEKNTLILGCNNTVIPDGIREILSLAFLNCKDLTDVTLPETITRIWDVAFYGCKNLKSINFPEGLEYLGWFSFGNTGLTSISIPASVTIIASDCFDYSTDVISIEVDENNPIYDSRNGCNAIIETSTNILIRGCQNTIIPNGITEIAASAFSGAKGLEEIAIPASVTTIGGSAFSSCSSLTSISISDNITEIGRWAFEGCENLQTFIMNDIEIETPLSAKQKHAKKSTKGKTLGIGLLGDCNSLENIILSKNVVSMGDSLFYNCNNVARIEIPESVLEMGKYMFLGCDSLQSIASLAAIPPMVNSETFNDVDRNMPLYVPEGSVEVYRTAEYWSEFANIQSISALIEVDKSYYIDCNNQEEWLVDEHSDVTAVFTNVNTGSEVTQNGVILQSNENGVIYTAVYFNLLAEDIETILGVESPAFTHVEFILRNDGDDVKTTGRLYYGDSSKPIYSLAKSEWYALDPQATNVQSSLADDANLPVEYYDLSGRKIEHPTQGVYIMKQGYNVRKVVK